MRGVLPFLLLCFALTGCEAAFPIVVDPDATAFSETDGKVKKDGSIVDGGGGDDVVSDSYFPPPPVDSGLLWCGTSDAGTGYCNGTCCVKVGNGYQFSCRPGKDPCSGYHYAFSCTRPSDCPNGQLCCYTEQGSIEGGTFTAESHCGTCNQMDSMCLYPAGDDCPDQTVCHPWFSNYGLCY